MPSPFLLPLSFAALSGRFPHCGVEAGFKPDPRAWLPSVILVAHPVGNTNLRPVGNSPLILDNEAFRRGFLAARCCYFEDIYGKDSRGPKEPQRATRLSSEEVLRLVLMPDQQWRYHFDEMGSENLPEYLGYLAGYLGGHFAPQEAEHETEPLPMTVLQEA